MLFSPIRNDRKKKTHKQNFGTHPVPRQSRKVVYVYFGGAPSTVEHFWSEILETPRKRSQSKFRISKFRTVGDPQTLENKAEPLPRLISELCYPQYGWYRFLFWKGPFHGTARAGHEFPNSTGGTSDYLFSLSLNLDFAKCRF